MWFIGASANNQGYDTELAFDSVSSCYLRGAEIWSEYVNSMHELSYLDADSASQIKFETRNKQELQTTIGFACVPKLKVPQGLIHQ